MFERKKSAGKIYALPIESIQPSPFQARTNFNEQELAGLAASIRENGLLQPIAVRKKETAMSWWRGAAPPRLQDGKDADHPGPSFATMPTTRRRRWGFWKIFSGRI